MKPPPTQDLFEEILKKDGGKRYFEIASTPVGPAPNGRYLHWDKLFHLAPPDGWTKEDWWLAVKLARFHLYQELPFTDGNGKPFKYAIFEGVLRMLHRIDRDAGGAIKGIDHPVTSSDSRDRFLIKSLVEEAITSSQLEGAATTRKVAKEMLRSGRKPRNRSEHMIYNNYQAMRFIGDLRDQPLTRSIILELQTILTQNAIDDPTAAGRFRREDESILVVDEVGQVLHTPPSAKELPDRVDALCGFANAREEPQFLHPVIRAVLLHFQLAYDHPFVDGNGRTARALFYWSMKNSGYWLSEFFSISRILKRATAAYVRAFLHTETDENDVTYFILSQLRVIIQAVEALHDSLERSTRELRETEILLRRNHSLRQELNHRQLAVVNHALKNPLQEYTFQSHRWSHDISYQTARTDLLGLAALGLLDQARDGRAFVFTVPPDLHARIGALSA